jgi:hypothetical protein
MTHPTVHEITIPDEIGRLRGCGCETCRVTTIVKLVDTEDVQTDNEEVFRLTNRSSTNSTSSTLNASYVSGGTAWFRRYTSSSR